MRVFIASAHKEGPSEGDARYLEVRRKIEQLGLRPRLDPWLAEYADPDLVRRGWRSIVDTCVHALHNSDLMVVLLFRRWGNAIEIDTHGPSPVSYLEIELFHASLRRIPIIFFQAEDFIPEPRLQSMIQMLGRVTSPRQWVKAPAKEIERRLLDTLKYLSKEGQLPPGMTGFCDALSDKVSFRSVDQEVNSSGLSFLQGFRPEEAGSVSLDRVDLLLSETEQLSGGGEGSFVDRLSRLWLALRDLAQQPSEALDESVARRWIRLCELWTSSAAWLHLHGPLELGVLATLHTRVQLREAGYLREDDFPFGAFASEAYSIAKTSDTLSWQRRRFEAARRLATKQISLVPEDPSGAYGIRASASMQLAQRGKPWLGATGLLDYKRMLETRKRIGASNSEIGEAKVELGYAQFAFGRRLPWTRRYALQQLRDGVAMLEADRPGVRAGFVKRAKIKFADALERSGLLDEAREQREGLEVFIRKHGLPME